MFINLESTGPGGPDVVFQHTGTLPDYQELAALICMPSEQMSSIILRSMRSSLHAPCLQVWLHLVHWHGGFGERCGGTMVLLLMHASLLCRGVDTGCLWKGRKVPARLGLCPGGAPSSSFHPLVTLTAMQASQMPIWCLLRPRGKASMRGPVQDVLQMHLPCIG